MEGPGHVVVHAEIVRIAAGQGHALEVGHDHTQDHLGHVHGQGPDQDRGRGQVRAREQDHERARALGLAPSGLVLSAPIRPCHRLLPEVVEREKVVIRARAPS